MVDYAVIVQIGFSILVIILFGFIAFKFGFLPMSSVSTLNFFLFKVCYLCLVAQNLSKKKIKELNFMPFVVGALTTIATFILFLLFFLIPYKDRFKNYLGAVLPCVFVNYIVVGFPIFYTMWDREESIMLPMITLSNDLITTPIYLVLSNIYLSKHQPREIGPGGTLVKKKTGWDICKIVVIQMVKSPIILGNVLGVIWSCTGWKLPTFLNSLMDFLGSEVLGICLICVGGFIAQNSIVACNWIKFLVCVFARHVIMPFFTLLFCMAFKMSNRLSRQCVLMSTLPTGTTSFIMSSISGIGPGVSSTMIFWTTLLCIPFLICWIEVLDKLKIFVDE
ncbi:intracellular auxin transport [Tritrichomonas musculus]|uniref:Intracellular auxin transport n=1 Tax=Tritrichomonas musculus TaxID=1915356 RepID=A0ABR2IQL4_9EUKA